MAKTAQEMVIEAKARIQEIMVEQFKTMLDENKDLMILDVREGEETQNGAIRGAQLLPRGFLELKIENLEPRRDRTIVVYCAGGMRSALAADTLTQMGYRNIYSLVGGFKAWLEGGNPAQRP